MDTTPIHRNSKFFEYRVRVSSMTLELGTRTRITRNTRVLYSILVLEILENTRVSYSKLGLEIEYLKQNIKISN